MQESAPPSTAPDCIICGYSLVGLADDGVCPECGTEIARSLKGDLLRYADQDWLNTVWNGGRLVHGSLLALLLSLLGMALITLVMFVLEYWSGIERGVDPLTGTIFSIIAAVAPFVLIVGLWKMSAPEPRVLMRGGARHVAFRALSLAVIPAAGVVLSAKAWEFFFNWPPWAALAAGFIGFGVIVAHSIMFIDLLQSLDRRCAEPDEKRRQLLAKYRSQGIGCAVLVALISIPAVFLLTRTSMFGVTFLVWLAIVSHTRGTLRRIKNERDAAPQMTLVSDAASVSHDR